MGRRGPQPLIDPDIIRGWPEGYRRGFHDLKSSDSFRRMVYKAGRKARRIRLFDQKTKRERFVIEVRDHDTVTE